MNRTKNPRIRLVKTRTDSGDRGPSGPVREVVGIMLGYRVVITEQAEVWTLRGMLPDGTPTDGEIGELSFVLIPGTGEPAVAITGFVSPMDPYVLAFSEDALWKQLREIVVMLGYDREGFYASVGLGGRHCYYEEYQRDD